MRIQTPTTGSGLYFHIPFCNKKCPYCHFFVLPNRDQAIFMEALEQEWHLRQEQMEDWQIDSLYFGGGTPSLLELPYLEKVLGWVNCEGEVTLEVNPEGVDLEKLKQFRTLGINRLSIGVQSLHTPTLQMLGREHDSERAKKCILEAREAGFENISIDLMYEIPFQSEESWESTLAEIVSLPITHLSLYNLTIEPHTAFFKKREELEKGRPEEEVCLKMLHRAVGDLKKAGLHRYEISAFAKEGFEAVHNTGYWKGKQFLGFGPSAFSFVDGARFQNVKNLRKYADAVQRGRFPTDFSEKLPYPANLREQLAVRLRLLSGHEVHAPEEVWTNLRELEGDGLVSIDDSWVSLSARGVDLYDSVAAALI